VTAVVPLPAATPARRRQLLPMLVAAEWRLHPWRQAAAVLAVALGVALAFAVQVINGSALAEFEQAVRAAGGTPDAAVRGTGASFDESLYPLVARLDGVAVASPVVEVETAWRDGTGHAQPVKVLGLDALLAPGISTGWLPLPAAAGASAAAPKAASSALAGGATARDATTDDARLEVLDPDVVFANAAARAAFGDRDHVALQTGAGWRDFRVAGRLAAEGPPLLVIDIAGAQSAFGRLGQLSRIDVRLRPGVSVEALRTAIGALPTASAALRVTAPDAPAERMERLTRSYRVNLGVLALVALFTGGFLVFSVQSLAVAKRIPQLALLGVLGLEGRGRRLLVLSDGALVGLVGSALGLAIGTALAAAALRALGGDLGSGLLGGVAPPLHVSLGATLGYGALGLASALAGALWPARAAEAIAPAQSLKGLSTGAGRPWPAAAGLALMALGLGLAFVPPWGDLPWAAYAGVGLLLVGGIGLVPQVVALALSRWRRVESPVLSLAIARAVDQRHTATAAVAGVVASLSLVVALTVMITSFRDSLSDWLGEVLPADLYVRPNGDAPAPAYLPPAVIAAAEHAPAVHRWRLQRQEPLSLSPDEPTAVLLARDGPEDAAPPALPWVQGPDERRDEPPSSAAAAASGPVIDVYPSEVLAALHHLHLGDLMPVPLPAPSPKVTGRVRGIWRDYARQQGALVIARQDWLHFTGDARVTDAALWLRRDLPARDRDALIDSLKAASPADVPVDTWTVAQLRAVSLDIFDRSFAVTRWLQGVALAIGLAGIAASFSAQVLARRREFGTLQHLGFTRRQVLALVTWEGALWTGVGAAIGVALGLVVSVVLVDVVNPQSFHWTMRWSVPAARLAELAVAAVVAGAATAFVAGQAAASRDMARAVKEDW
jgi:putative ABC transport system permease protein